MADKIHKQKKSWPHFDKIHLGSKAYADGWDRIFGRKSEEVDEGGRGRQVQKVDRPVTKKRRKKSKGSRGVDR